MERGGYLLKWRGTGIAIDPGFDFLRNFHDARYHGREINAVIVSHNHSDHNADLKSIDDLRYELFKRQGHGGGATLGPYVLIWDLDTRDSTKPEVEEPEHHFTPIVFNVGSCNPCAKIDSPHGLPFAVEYFRVKHGPSTPNAVGFRLRLEKTDGSEFIIGYTGDTEFFSDLPDRLSGCDLLLAHISQPETRELSDPNARKKNHLGYRGLAELIRLSSPRAAVVSEFWAGRADLRIDLTQGLRMLTGTSAILPGAIGMHIALPDMLVECTQCGTRVPFTDVRVSPPADSFAPLAYLCKDCVIG